MDRSSELSLSFAGGEGVTTFCGHLRKGGFEMAYAFCRSETFSGPSGGLFAHLVGRTTKVLARRRLMMFR